MVDLGPSQCHVSHGTQRPVGVCYAQCWMLPKPQKLSKTLRRSRKSHFLGLNPHNPNRCLPLYQHLSHSEGTGGKMQATATYSLGNQPFRHFPLGFSRLASPGFLQNPIVPPTPFFFQGSFFLDNLRKPRENGRFLERTMAEKNGRGINP